VSRLGGDEFFVICTHTPQEGAQRLAEKMRQAVAALRVPTGSGEWHGSVSIGVAVRKEEMRNFEALIKAADEGVYAAKKDGRNRVALAP
jgi:hemerythrin